MSNQSKPDILGDTDVVVYDGNCNFCNSQINIIRKLDILNKLSFISLHDPSVPILYPQVSKEKLLTQIYIFTKDNRYYGGAECIQQISKKLFILWPLYILLKIPFSFPLWDKLYKLVAKNRFKIAGTCTNNSCKL